MRRLLLLGLVWCLGSQAGFAATSGISDVRIGSLSTKGAIIRWNTDTETVGQVSYGPTTAYGSTVAEEEATKDHYVFLGDLSPDATYHYQVQSGETKSDDASFTTVATIEDLWPVVSISFDDGKLNHFTTAYPLMRERNMRGMVNVVTDRLPKQVGMSLNQVLFLARQGWEVASHSRSHYRDKTLTYPQEIVGSITYLKEQGMTNVTSYRVPGGRHSEAAETLAARYYPLRWGAVLDGPPSPRFATLPLKPGRYAGVPLDFIGTTSVEERVNKYKAALDAALAQRMHAHFIFHAIEDQDSPGWNYSPAEFAAFLDYLQARGVRVVPPGELLAEYTLSEPADGQ